MLEKMKTTKNIILFILLLALASSYSAAVSIGISPGRVNFQNVLKEGYAERTVTITTSSDVAIQGHFKVTGGLKDWISLEPNSTTFEISKDSPYKLKIIMVPPKDAPNGNYSGQIEVITDTIGSVGGRAGGVIKTAVILIVNTEVSGLEIIKCRAGGFNFKDVEKGFPVEFSLVVINDGNIRLRPSVSIDIWDQLQENLILSTRVTGDEVLPTTEKKIFGRIHPDLELGQYWVKAKAEQCNQESFGTFSVVNPGDIVDNGILKDIIHQPWMTIGQTMEIIVEFVNTGPRSVNAKFNGAIRLDNKIVQVIETDEQIVESGQTAEFPVYFTPDEPGRYSLNGKALYNKKLTFEKGSVINVVPAEGAEQPKGYNALPLLIYIIILVTIIFIVRKILRERKSH